MLDFCFHQALSLEELKKDENLKITNDGDRIIIELANEEHTGMWTYQVNNEYVWDFEGHDGGTPVAMYIYDKYGIPFSDDMVLHLDEALDKIRKMYCLGYMKHFFGEKAKESYKSLYEKILKDMECNKYGYDLLKRF